MNSKHEPLAIRDSADAAGRYATRRLTRYMEEAGQYGGYRDIAAEGSCYIVSVADDSEENG